MKLTCALVFGTCVALLSCGGETAYADQVDDLLAGKPVKIEAPVAEEPAPIDTATHDRTERSGTQRTVPLTENSWELTLSDGDHVRPVEIASQAGNEENRPAAPPTGAISLVPEPSAIALAAAALVYFLIFFRRRYSF